MMRIWKSKQQKTVESQAHIVKSAVAGINDLVKEIHELVDAKKDGEKNGSKHSTS